MSNDYPVYPFLPEAGLELHLVPESGSELDLQVRQGDELLFDERIEHGSWRSGETRARIAGRISRQLPESGDYHEEEVKVRVKRALNRIAVDETENEEEFEEQTRPQEVRDLIEQTRRVVTYPGEEDAQWVAELTPPEESPKVTSQKITFTAGELNNLNPGGFTTKYLAVFLQSIELDSAAWVDYRDHLLEIAEPESSEVDSRKEALLERFLQEINSRSWDVIDKDDTADHFRSDPDARVAIYHENWDSTESDAVLIPNTWVNEFRQEHSAGDLDLSKELRDRDILLDSTTEIEVDGTRTRVWPVAAAETDYAGKENLWSSEDTEEPDGIDV